MGILRREFETISLPLLSICNPPMSLGGLDGCLVVLMIGLAL